MAIIKCPECGRQISDKAPVCPNCGVEIAGKIIKCTQCGEVYFNNQEFCPNCHHPTHAHQQAAAPTERSATPPPHNADRPTARPSGMPPVPPTEGSAQTSAQQPAPEHKKGKTVAIVIGLVIAVLICGICFYFYHTAKGDKEQEAYEFAMKSDDPLVLQTYLSNNADAPQAHRDSVTARLDFLMKQDNEWANAVASGSKAALEDYLARNPNSEHAIEAKHKIDSIDWADATNENTLEAMQTYLTQHATGEHVDEANDAIKKIKANSVQPEDRTLVTASLRHFFQSINSKSEMELEASVTPLLTNFLGKSDATKADVVTFMKKIYKENISNMNWRLGSDYKIDKKDIGIEQYEYTVGVSATQSIDYTDGEGSQQVRYQIKATINPDGLISALSMTKILE